MKRAGKNEVEKIGVRYLRHENYEEGFWSRIDKSAGIDACWIWTHHRDADGYGKAHYKKVGYKRRTLRAHRVAYMLANSVTLTAEQFVCHSCDNPGCCNPRHLWLGTREQNQEDMVAKRRGANQHGRIPDAVVCAIQNDSRPSEQLAIAFGIHPASVRRIRNGTRGCLRPAGRKARRGRVL